MDWRRFFRNSNHLNRKYPYNSRKMSVSPKNVPSKKSKKSIGLFTYPILVDRMYIDPQKNLGKKANVKFFIVTRFFEVIFQIGPKKGIFSTAKHIPKNKLSQTKPDSL